MLILNKNRCEAKSIPRNLYSEGNLAIASYLNYSNQDKLAVKN